MPDSIIPADPLPPGTRVILDLRVSERSQVAAGSLLSQHLFVENFARAHGFKRVGQIYGVESGKLSEPRPLLHSVIDLGRQNRAGILVRDVPRLVRPESFDKVTNPKALATAEDIAALLALADGVPFIATIKPPDATYQQIHGAATSEGMERTRAAGKRLGRRRSYDEEIQSEIIENFLDGFSLRENAERNGVTKQAVDRCIRAFYRQLSS